MVFAERIRAQRMHDEDEIVESRCEWVKFLMDGRSSIRFSTLSRKSARANSLNAQEKA